VLRECIGDIKATALNSKADDLSKHAKKALNQIESMRYGADLKNPNKQLVKVGIAICGKLCRVMCTVVSD